jgi:hypothetical protein
MNVIVTRLEPRAALMKATSSVASRAEVVAHG